MGQDTRIQWTDYSSNPIRAKLADGGNRIPGHYCEKISPGCANCYASKTQARFRMPKFPGASKREVLPSPDGYSLSVLGKPEIEVMFNDIELQRLMRSRKISGKRVFICDMTDMFGHWVPDAWLDRLFALFALRHDVTWQVLTKRPERMAEYLAGAHERTQDVAAEAGWITKGPGFRYAAWPWPLPNVWLGTSVENQAAADERIPHLLRCPAAVRFLSMEPLLGPVDLKLGRGYCRACNQLTSGAIDGHCMDPESAYFAGEAGLDSLLHWVIVGGESGPREGPNKARPCYTHLVRSLVEQCKYAGVAVFVKQLGTNAKMTENETQMSLGGVWTDYNDRKGGDPAEWPEDLHVRQFPQEVAHVQ